MNILSEVEGSVAVVTINRPKQLNALNKETISQLSDVMQKHEEDASVRVVVLTGSGEKAFVAGADIKEFYQFDKAGGMELARKGHEILFDKIANMKTPVVAAINGFALGGGLELAMSCSIRIASSNAKMGLPEVSLGVIPGYGGTQRLAQLVGKGLATQMVITAQMIDAEKALQSGLVTEVVSQEELLSVAMKLAGKIARNSPVAIGFAMKAINAGYQDGLNGFDVEIAAFGECFGTSDFIEGTTAFVEKRKANFPGE